ncbi:MAG: FAD-dependent oxidoreductase [bacterium]
MSTVGVVGGGPAGLSAALFTQKNGLNTVVFDTDKTWMHQAHLLNYPGIGSMDGSAYMDSLRSQVKLFGVDLNEESKITEIQPNEETYTLSSEDEQVDVDYVVLATGSDRGLAESLGCEFNGDLVDVTLSMETSLDGVYATGAMVRDQEWQAIISAGDGAAAALDILSREKGEDFHDFDTPEQVALQFGEGY